MEKKVTEEQKKLAVELVKEFKETKSTTIALSAMAHAFCISPKYQAMGRAAALLEKTIFDQFEDPSTVGPALSHISRAILGVIYYETLKTTKIDENGREMFKNVLTNGDVKGFMEAINASNELFESLGLKSPIGDVFKEDKED